MTIDYERLQALTREFGFDPREVMELRFTPRALHVTEFVIGDDGQHLYNTETNTMETRVTSIPVGFAGVTA